MAGTERMRLTDAAIARLRPREREYTVWDTRTPGLGVRVRPSSATTFVLLRKSEGRSVRRSLGRATSRSVEDVRRQCHTLLATPDTVPPTGREHNAPPFRGHSAFVFPSDRNSERPHAPRLPLWDRVRKEAGIEDVRLNDLHHTMASHAVMNGVPVPVVSRLLGHANVQMTLRYAHLADRDIETAAQGVGVAMARAMALL